MIRTYKVDQVVTSGAAGSASGSAASKNAINGRLCAIHIDYGSEPATCDVIVATAGKCAPAQTLITVSNNATDGWYYPSSAAQDNTGAAISGVYSQYAIDDIVSVTVAQGDGSGTVDVTLLMEQ